MVDIEWEDGVLGGLFIVMGFFLVFFGYRLFKTALFLTGVFFGYVIMYSILVNAGVTDEITLVFSSLGTGVVVGILLVWMVTCVAKAVIFLVGFLFGFMLCIYVFSWSEELLIEDNVYRWLTIVASGVVFGCLSVCVLRKIIIIISTSYYGSYFVFYGIDVFAQTGFTEAFKEILSGKENNSEWDEGIYAMLVCSLVLFGAGVAVQFFVTAKDYDYEPEEEGYQRI
jgi:hypothetical protein